MHSIDSFRGDCDVRVWLCQIAKNCYYSYRKKSNRIEHVDEDAIQELPDHALTVYIDEQTVSAERLAEILLGIRKCFDEEGLTERVKASNQAAQIYYSTEDAEKNIETE